MADDEDKTHAPSEHKLEEARKKGDVPSAQEARHAVMMGAVLLGLLLLGPGLAAGLAGLMAALLGGAGDAPLEGGSGWRLVADTLGSLGLLLGPMVGLLLGAALLAGLSQGRPTLSWERVRPQLSRVSPLSGMKRLLGAQALAAFGKTVAKLAAVLLVVVLVLKPEARGLDQLVGASAQGVAAAAGGLVLMLLKAVVAFLVALAAFDFWYQFRSFLKRMRMSRQELKDEHKQNDGDPQVKARMRAIGLARSRRRMMAAVPTASVVVTNPTHYAVALKYDHGRMQAPVVVAKGTDAVALKIREVAAAHGVPVVESPPLARALYAGCEIDRPIDPAHYAAVAEVISYVMRLAKR